MASISGFLRMSLRTALMIGICDDEMVLIFKSFGKV